jgi:arylsulfatase A-like enzyme
VISADHGFSDVDGARSVAPGKEEPLTVTVLQEKGIEHAGISTGGTSGGIYLRDKKRLREAVDLLRAQPWCEAIYCENEAGGCDRSLSSLDAYFAGRSPDIMIDLDDDALFGRPQPGAHGSMRPSDLRIPLVFSGAGVGAGRTLGKAHLVDVAPTVLRLLGLTPRAMKLDGRVLEEALASPAP